MLKTKPNNNVNNHKINEKKYLNFGEISTMYLVTSLFEMLSNITSVAATNYNNYLVRDQENNEYKVRLNVDHEPIDKVDASCEGDIFPYQKLLDNLPQCNATVVNSTIDFNTSVIKMYYKYNPFKFIDDPEVAQCSLWTQSTEHYGMIYKNVNGTTDENFLNCFDAQMKDVYQSIYDDYQHTIHKMEETSDIVWLVMLSMAFVALSSFAAYKTYRWAQSHRNQFKQSPQTNYGAIDAETPQHPQTDNNPASEITILEDEVEDLQATNNNSNNNQNDPKINFENLKLEPKIIGKGNFGKVYRGIWHCSISVTDTNVAVRVLDIKEIKDKNFDADVLVMSKLHNAHVVEFYGTVKENKHQYMVMEYIPGGSLRELLDHNTAMTDEQQKQLAFDIAQGLAYLHQHNVVHANLNSMNVLLDANGRAKLADVGLAKIKGNPPSMLGAWSAPEEFKGEKSTSASDMWHYGVVLWEICTNQIPFQGLNSVAIMHKVASKSEPLAIPHSSSSKLTDLMKFFFEKTPSNRLTAKSTVKYLQTNNTNSSSVNMSNLLRHRAKFLNHPAKTESSSKDHENDNNALSLKNISINNNG